MTAIFSLFTCFRTPAVQGAAAPVARADALCALKVLHPQSGNPDRSVATVGSSPKAALHTIESRYLRPSESLAQSCSGIDNGRDSPRDRSNHWVSSGLLGTAGSLTIGHGESKCPIYRAGTQTEGLDTPRNFRMSASGKIPAKRSVTLGGSGNIHKLPSKGMVKAASSNDFSNMSQIQLISKGMQLALHPPTFGEFSLMDSPNKSRLSRAGTQTESLETSSSTRLAKMKNSVKRSCTFGATDHGLQQENKNLVYVLSGHPGIRTGGPASSDNSEDTHTRALSKAMRIALHSPTYSESSQKMDSPSKSRLSQAGIPTENVGTPSSTRLAKIKKSVKRSFTFGASDNALTVQNKNMVIALSAHPGIRTGGPDSGCNTKMTQMQVLSKAMRIALYSPTYGESSLKINKTSEAITRFQCLKESAADREYVGKALADVAAQYSVRTGAAAYSKPVQVLESRPLTN